MDGTAAARQLNGGSAVLAAAAAHRYDCALAGPQDDEEIRRLLRDSPLPGQVRVTFEREPDFFAAARLEGAAPDVILARDGERIVAMAVRSVRERFVDGRPARVAYLSSLRLAPGYTPTRTLINQGFAQCGALQETRPADVHFASVAAGHTSAQRLLEGGRHGLPPFAPIDRLATLALAARSVRARRHRGLELVTGADVGAPALAAFLWRATARFQLAPCWNAGDLAAGPGGGLCPDDFAVALRGGTIIGCLALWDQRGFKQVVVRGYAPALRVVRPLANIIAPLAGMPRLPRIGAPIRFAHLSHLGLDRDHPEVLEALIGQLARRARRRGLDTLMFGVSVRHPLTAFVRRRFRHREYATVLYASSVDGTAVDRGSRTMNRAAHEPSFPARIAHPEGALL